MGLEGGGGIIMIKVCLSRIYGVFDVGNVGF